MIDFDLRTITFDCERCKNTGIDPIRIDHDPDYCNSCDGDRELFVFLGTLFDNLYAAGAMQAMFDAGVNFEESCWRGRSEDAWRPNIAAQAAPGWATCPVCKVFGNEPCDAGLHS